MIAGRVITVAGEIDADELGFCQPHEHLCIERGPAADMHPALLIDEPDRTAVDLKAYKAAGGSAVVDAQPLFTGRNARTLLRLSEECGIHVIASTGFHKLFYYGIGNPFLAFDEDRLAGLFISEISEGMIAAAFCPHTLGYNAGCADAATSPQGRTRIRAGIIKAALEPEFTELHTKLFGAAAKASAATGAPIMIHVDKGADPLRLARFLAERGVNPVRTVYCHLDRAVDDAGVHCELMENGAYAEYDTVARPQYYEDEAEASMVVEMLECGFSDRIMISLDVTRSRLRGYGGVPGLDYILTGFIPLLKTHGAKREALHMISTANPSSVLSNPRLKKVKRL